MNKRILAAAIVPFLFFGGIGAIQSVVILVIVWEIADFAYRHGKPCT